MLAALLLPLCVSAEPSRIPHEDPNAVIDELNQDAILLYYAQILMKIDQGDYASAVKMLDRLKFAHLPEQQRKLLERYSGLIGKLPDSISSSRELLSLATSLIAQYRITEAGETLDEADGVIDQLSIYLSNIDKDTENIGDAFSVFTAPNGSSLNISYSTLVNSVGQIWEIEDEITNLRGLLKSNLASALAKNLQKTILTIELTPSSAYVGDNITVYGSLSTNTSRLTGRNISVLLDGKIIATAATDPGGRYMASIQLPYKYVSNMPVRALYIPTGSDLTKYLPAVSPLKNASSLFYQSVIELGAQDEVYLGLPAVFSGTASWEQSGNMSSRSIEIYLDNELLKTVAGGVGVFAVETTIGIDVSLGEHTVRAVIADSGRYVGAADEKTVSVSKAPLRVDVKAPSFLVVPGKISITGKVTSDLPLKGGTAVIDFGGKSTTVDIQNNGEFSAQLNLGLAQGLIGSQTLTVTVYPVEPWNDTTAVTVRVFVLNAVNLFALVLGLALGTALGAVTYTRRKRRRPLKKTFHHKEAPAAGKLTPVPLEDEVQTESQGNKERLLQAYTKAVRVMEKKYSIKMEPHMTMREFSSTVRSKLPGAGEGFYKLTMLAEKALYSPHETEAADAAAAAELLSTIVKAGKNAAA